MKRHKDRHEPVMLKARGVAWVECSCGWVSPAVPGGAPVAALMWAGHLREMGN